MPSRFVRKVQCIELCRGENHDFAVEKKSSKECHCLKKDPDKSISSGTDSCVDKDNQVTFNLTFLRQWWSVPGL